MPWHVVIRATHANKCSLTNFNTHNYRAHPTEYVILLYTQSLKNVWFSTTLSKLKKMFELLKVNFKIIIKPLTFTLFYSIK